MNNVLTAVANTSTVDLWPTSAQTIVARTIQPSRTGQRRRPSSSRRVVNFLVRSNFAQRENSARAASAVSVVDGGRQRPRAGAVARRDPGGVLAGQAGYHDAASAHRLLRARAPDDVLLGRHPCVRARRRESVLRASDLRSSLPPGRQARRAISPLPTLLPPSIPLSLPRLAEELVSHFQQYAPPTGSAEDLWLEFQGQPLKWPVSSWEAR